MCLPPLCLSVMPLQPTGLFPSDRDMPRPSHLWTFVQKILLPPYNFTLTPLSVHRELNGISLSRRVFARPPRVPPFPRVHTFFLRSDMPWKLFYLCLCSSACGLFPQMTQQTARVQEVYFQQLPQHHKWKTVREESLRDSLPNVFDAFIKS